MSLYPLTDWLVFLDETGDHNLRHIDPSYPVFGLAAITVRWADYQEQILPRVNALRYRYFGHEGITLRSYDIRRQKGPYGMLTDRIIRTAFMEDLSGLMKAAPLQLFYIGIEKAALIRQMPRPHNPYEVAFQYLMEQLMGFVQSQHIAALPIIAEARGEREDRALQQEFNRVRNEGTTSLPAEHFQQCRMDLRFAQKKRNVVGLQLADLCAYPLGRHQATGYVGPDFRIVQEKLTPQLGWKIFP